MMRKLRSIHVFFCVVLGMALFSVCYLLKTHGSALDLVIFISGGDRFMDFFNHISYVRNPGDVYFASPHACFPPLVYGMYYFFSKILPVDATVMYNAGATSSYALLLYVIYCVVLAVLLFYSVYKLLWKRGIEFSLAVTLVIIMSNVFIFSVIERGNSVLIVCILLMRALELREHDGVKSELALIFIALAAGIKIYPAVFGLIYIFEKRWKEAGRLVIYGVLGFFVPFAFFGGVRGMKQFLLNQKFLQSSGNACLGSIKSLWDKIYGDLLIDNISADLGWVGISLAAFFLGMVIVSGWLCEDQYKRILLLTSAMILVPFWSGDYTIIYMTLPLVFFLREEFSQKGPYILYALIFSLFIYDNPILHLILGTSVPVAMVFLCVYIMSIPTIIEILRHHKDVKPYKTDEAENL